MGTIVIRAAAEQTGSPRPATGKHAEMLQDLKNAATRLLQFVELELSGVCGGNGYWVGNDPVVDAAKQVLKAAELRVGELRR